MKKLWSMVLAVALTAVMVLGTCCAEKVITDKIEDGYSKVDAGNFVYDVGAYCTANNIDITTVGGVKLTIKVSSLDAGFGGGFIYNTSTAGGWDQNEWGNEGANKAITAVATDDASGLEFTISHYGENKFGTTEDANGLYNNFCLSSWWGADIDVTAIQLLDTTGAPIVVSTPDGSAPTGDMTNIAILAGVAALALVAVVASKKANA